jgi:signal transduction histidine kinase
MVSPRAIPFDPPYGGRERGAAPPGMMLPRGWGVLRSALAILVLLASASSFAAETRELRTRSDSPWLLFAGETVLSDSRSPPPASAAWEPVELPESWRLTDRHLKGTSAWYRFRVADVAPEEPYALYLWRFSMNVAAFFNDELIGSGGSFDEPIARNWNRPFLFPIPRTAWRSGENWLYVHLKVYPGWGTFTPPAFGPLAVLEPAYQSRYFYQITLSQVSLVVTAVVMILGFVFWSVDWRDRTYLFFALASAAWCVYSLNLFVQTIPVSARTWWWFVHTMIDAFTLNLVCFAHRLLGVRRHRLELAMAGTVIVASTLYALWDLPTMARGNNVVHSLMLLWPTYLIVWVARVAIRDRTTESIVFGTCFVLLFALGIHDVFLNSLLIPELWATRFFLLQFGAPIMLLVLAVHLALRLSRAIAETRAANVHLEERVREVSEALERSFGEREALERRQAVTAERDRIYQDLHDDVGARLLSLVYAADGSKVGQLARESLAAMRSIVSSDRIEGGALGDIAADWRAETETRCEAAGFALHWDEEVDRSLMLNGLARYHLDRVLRELVSNVLEHSGGRTLDVRLATEGGVLRIAVEDDGAGLASDRLGGSGLRGIRRRIAELGGAVEWARPATGGTRCQVEVVLPPIGG